MLDYSYANWFELFKACQAAQNWLRSTDNPSALLVGNINDYSFHKVKAKFAERTFCRNGEFFTRVVSLAYFD